ncbi:rust resistance kinase Lr10-like [Cannabis sativa]|uniref:rust resistance kinase Lr10-like n=1 Tax=Cannabis sativa TaxID=3483 RepID=UPI0029CA5FA2|nr:rust resistance kinase Lr10-like [Cannabis sativa]
MNMCLVKVVMIISYIYYSLFMITLVLAETQTSHECKEVRCDENGPPIRFPFRLKGKQPSHCGYDPGFDLSCTHSNQTLLHLPNLHLKLHVTKIDYEEQSLKAYNPYCIQKHNLKFLNLSNSPFFSLYSGDSMLLKCSFNESDYYGHMYSSPIPCLSDSSKYFVYAIGTYSNIWGDIVGCSRMYNNLQVPPTIFHSIKMEEVVRIYLWWSKPDCKYCESKGKKCTLIKRPNSNNATQCSKDTMKGVLFQVSLMTSGSFAIILGFLATFYVCHLGKNKRQNGLRIEKFLEDYIAFKPSRYTYADVRNITSEFKDKLGEGAYGEVFKGKLSNDISVAVKILNRVSKENGEDFINEVATIGQIHHINVVRLVGYCADGFRRALVYEFLPNDSLDKYISVRGSTDDINICSLSWEKLLDIVTGTAKGIEYLHQGCDKRILHFDIKPQNILLDHNFKPKIADFGLAKLCSKDQSIVSMSTARGTIGYIAPEVFSRNFGNVSYKSDVYSFGMLLLEIVGGRRSNNTNEIYYPEWIFNLLEEGEDLRIYIDEGGDGKIAKKLAIVGLQCIQWHPIDRPTMKVVVQMLEGNEELSMPPNPFSSTNPSKQNTKMPKRLMTTMELETIAE